VRLALVGATGAVGTVILSILEERGFEVDELVPIASPRSAGRKLFWRGDTAVVRAISPEVFDGVDIALFDVPDELSVEWAPIAAARGAVVIDNSAAWRMDPEVPLVVPEINPEAVAARPKGIIASPNCTTLAMIVPLAALHRVAGLRRVIASSYQAASGSGKGGIDELLDQADLVTKDREVAQSGLARDLIEAGETFSHPIAMNVIPQCGSFKEDGFTSEELKLCYETRKIMDLPELAVTATCVRVPVVTGHGVAVHAEFDRPISVAEAQDILRAAPGTVVVDDPSTFAYPTPLEAAGRDACYVGRIRKDPFTANGLEMFCVSDNLRKGAALNTVQVAELLQA
jgi:aspartate-semialdehyde dehydrogenase